MENERWETQGSSLFCSVVWTSWWFRCLQRGKPGLDPWVGKISWRRKWQPTPVFLPGKSHGCKSLWQATVLGVTKSQTWLRDFTFFLFLAHRCSSAWLLPYKPAALTHHQGSQIAPTGLHDAPEAGTLLLMVVPNWIPWTHSELTNPEALFNKLRVFPTYKADVTKLQS